MERYDFIICGAGLSGMILALFLVREFPDSSVLILEKNKGKYPYHRMWSFWANEIHPFEKIIEKEWKEFSVFSNNFESRYKLLKFRIQLLKSEKLFGFIDNELNKHKVVKKYETVVKTGSVNGLGSVNTKKGDTFYADWVFDSTDSDRLMDKKSLFMQGWGWEICAASPGFEPANPVFQDLRSSGQDLAFYYLLPVTDKKAYINLAVINPELNTSLMQEKEGIVKVRQYLSRYWGINDFQIRSSDFEVIPLSKKSFKRMISSRVMAIGVKGGLMKATTSYGFSFILKDSMRIVRSLKMSKTPFHGYKRKFYYRVLDSLTFDLMLKKPEKVLILFEQMFKTTGSLQGDAIMGFLNEENNFAENVNLLKTKNPLIFLG